VTRGVAVPLPPIEDRALRAIGARRRASGDPSTADLVRVLREVGRESPSLVALFDARAIAGDRHLLSAWAHLGRARARGEARLRDRGAEFALYVAGDDQLPRALEKVGVSDRSEELVVVAERPVEPTELVGRFGLIEEPRAFPRAVDGSTLDRLGISETERAAVPPGMWEALVLERVALVDLSAPAARRAPEKR
jgi:tRNA threonylcarbamoyladenosine modification (KEOPS) complex Cgi121 subunit